MTNPWGGRLSPSSSSSTKHSLDTGNRLGGVARGHGSHEKEENEDNSTKHNELALRGVVDAVLSPSTVGLSSVLLDLVTAKLVVNETDKSNRVAEKLSKGDGSLPDHHGGDDQEDIFENTAEGHNEGRSLADLHMDVRNQ